MGGKLLALAVAGCLGLSTLARAEDGFKDRIGAWQIGRNTSGSASYCYAAFEPAPGRKLVISVTSAPGVVVTLWDMAWSLPRGTSATVQASFDDQTPASLAGQVLLPQVVVVPITDWRPFVDRLSQARQLVMAVDDRRMAIDLASASAAYAEVRKCIDGIADGALPQESAATRVPGWVVAAERSNESFLGCTAIPDRPAQPISLRLSRRFDHVVRAVDRRWKGTVGERIAAVARIDGVGIATSAVVQEPGTILMRIADPRAYLALLRSGRRLTVAVGDAGIDLDIAGASPAIAALEQCARREVAKDGPRISSGGYSLQSVQAFAIALLRDAGIDGFDLQLDAEAFEVAHNIGWDYSGDLGAGSLQLLRNAPADYLDLRTARLLDLFRDACSGIYDARVLETATGPGWQARRLFTFCSEHETPGLAGVARWIVVRLDNGTGITFGSVRAAKADDPAEVFAKGGNIDEAVWRSALLRNPPPE